ncbi:MAG: metallophosphoesterase family protein [Deltaproteobacteria bacterium]|nr:metallophosphoesterase family protein [Deltaproteobacteria bacterium]
MRMILAAVVALLLFATTASAEVLKGPYLQNVTTEAITVCVETDEPAMMTIAYGRDDISEQSVSFNAGAYAAQTTMRLPEPDDKSAAGFDPQETTRYIYKMRLENLKRGKSYVYRVTSGEFESAEKSFVTAPHNLTPYTFVAFGDSRNGSPEAPNLVHEQVTQRVHDVMPAFYLNTGDFVASGEVYTDWDYHFYVENDLMGDAPMVPVFGNHEQGSDLKSGMSGDLLWAHYFDTGKDEDPTWFSFDYGNVHFIVIDVNKSVAISPLGAEYEWLKADIAAAKANPYTNFIIGTFHQPVLGWKVDRTPDIRSKFFAWPVLRDGGVDLVLTGHDHFYARAEIDGVPHVITAGGGAGLYDFIDDVEDQPGFKAASKVHHYTVLDVSPKMIELTAYDAESNAVIDSFTIEKDAAPEALPGDDDDDDDDTVDDDDDTADDDTVDDDTVDDDTVDDDTVDDDTVDDDVADDDTADDDASDDDVMDDDISDDDSTDDDDVGDDDVSDDDVDSDDDDDVGGGCGL